MNLGNYFNDFLSGLPSLLVAILLVIVALVLAGLVRSLIKKGAAKLNLQKKLGADETSGKQTVDMLGNLGYIIVLLLFLPGILDKLGLPSISVPILGMLNSVFGYIPNLIGAAIILAIGFYLAKLIKDLLAAFLKRIRLDSYQERFGIKKTTGSRLNISDMLANIVYVLILIPIIIAALNTLNISVISQPAVAMLNDIFQMIPRILAGIIIMVIGVFLAKLVADFVYSLLEGSGLSEKVADLIQDTAAYKVDLARILSEVVRYVILAVFLVQAFNVIQLEILDTAGIAILSYIPKVLAAALILVGAYLFGSVINRAITRNLTDGHMAGLVIKYVILTIGVLAALTQLGIATSFLLPVFQYSLGAVAIAAALAFGLGGRDFAARKLDELDAKLALQKPKMQEAQAKLKEAQLKREADYRRTADQAKTEFRQKKEEPARNYRSDFSRAFGEKPEAPAEPDRTPPAAPEEPVNPARPVADAAKNAYEDLKRNEDRK